MIRVIYLFYGLVISLSMVLYSYIAPSSWLMKQSGANEFDARLTIILFGLSFLFNYISSGDKLILIANKRQDYVNFISGITPVIVFLIWFIISNNLKGIWTLGFSTLITNVFFSFYCNLIVQKKHYSIKVDVLRRLYKSPIPDISFIKEFKKLGIGYFINTFTIIILQADVILVGILGGTKEVALFLIVWKIPQTYTLIISKLSETSAPYIISFDAIKDIQSINHITSKLFAIIFPVTILASLSYLSFGEYIVTNWLREDLTEIPSYWFYFASLASLLQCLARLPVVTLSARAKLNFINKTAIIEIIMKLIISIILYNNFGASSILMAIIICNSIWSIPRYYSKVTI